MNKNICPECGNELYYSKWFICEKLYKLDDVGKPRKKSFKTIKEAPYLAECGIICSNSECSYTKIPSGRVK